MYLLQELYVYLFEYADNINTTSYDYFKLLLNTRCCKM